MRLVPEVRRTLSPDDAMTEANEAYAAARAAQRSLLAAGGLLERLYRRGPVNHARLRQEQREALEQVDRARAVADALTRAIEAFEATRVAGKR